MSSRVQFEAIKELGFAAIGAAYASVGVVTAHEVRIVCITNNTEGDMYFTTDLTKNEMFVGAGSFKLYDLQTNKTPKTDSKYVFAIGTQFSVKQIEAPISGNVYIECIF